VLTNLPSVPDRDWGEEAARTVMELEGAVEDIAQMTRETVGSQVSRAPIDPESGEALEIEG